MKTLTITLALSFVSLLSFGQGFTEVAPGDWVYFERGADALNGSYLVSVSDNGLPLLSFEDYEEDDYGGFAERIPGEDDYLTRYLFDLDDGLEYIVTGFVGGNERDPYFEVRGIDLGEGVPGNSIRYKGSFVKIVSTNEGSYLLAYEAKDVPGAEELSYGLYRIPLPGYLPSFIPTNLQPKVITRTDTVYIERTTRDTVVIENLVTRVDTVYLKEVTSQVDTVYNETRVYVEGNIDTVYQITQQVTSQIDTVYRFTTQRFETSRLDTVYVYRIDSLYLLGSDYLADINRVTSVENQLEVRQLSNPYPNPASSTVSIDYVTATPSDNMFLGIYDSQGHRVGQFPVKVSGTITFDVSDWSSGVYVYMIWSPVGVSSTKKLVIE